MQSRLLTAADVPHFQSIRLESLRLEPKAYASTLAAWQDLTEEEWRTRITNHPTFASFQDAEPIALMGYMRQRSTNASHRASLVMVYLQARYRGQGIATDLLECVITHASTAGVRLLELGVNANNPAAIRFYHREGFQTMGIIPGGLLENGEEVDEILMYRRIG